jgi:hypothetical protein
MKWFIAKIVYQIICGDGDHTPQFDEQVRVITAYDEEEALQKALELGEREQDTFENHAKQLVQWKFVDVAELYQVDDWLDGAEIYSTIKEETDAEDYINYVRDKAAALRERRHIASINLTW